ncbi:YihY/virulence factor BrkB family protein [Rhodobacteraceae bacterium KMM 6894]|nr:YihY/virulence factor BrkB family protein [Rhodobacteraceae bacterium KMM 6894]
MVPRPHYGFAVWWSVAKRVFKMIDEKRLVLIAAGIAFFGILALFPAIAAIIALWGIIGDPQSILPLIQQYDFLFPAEVFSLISTQISALATADEGQLGWASILSILLALWSARAGVTALIQGMNAVYDESNRKGLRQYLAAIGLTLALVFVALTAIAAIVVTPVIMAFVPLGAFAQLLVEAIRWLVAVGILLAGAGLVYRYGPNRRAARLAWITPGAMLAVGLWTIASIGFSIYLANFGTYNEVYGSLGAVIALLMWLFISGFLLLIGGAVNSELERHTQPDSTVGPPRPIGERGAAAADTYLDTSGDA